MKVGYARVSTTKQDLTAQLHELNKLGVESDRIYVDHGRSGRQADRPGLAQALAACRSGDSLTVTKLDRLARSVSDAAAIAKQLHDADITLQIGADVYSPESPSGKLMFHMLAMIAEFEADLISARTREGMAIARKKGRLKGKQPKLSTKQQQLVIDLHEAGKHTQAEIAEIMEVSRRTIGRVLSKHRS